MPFVRSLFEQIAQNDTIGSLLAGNPIGREIVHRVVGGEQVSDAIEVAKTLADSGALISLERAVAGDPGKEEATVVLGDYAQAISALAASSLSRISEIAILPEFILGGSGRVAALGDLCAQARDSQISVMIGVGPDGLVDATFDLVEGLRADGFDVGMTLACVLRRTEADCARASGRVRLVKGAHSSGVLERFGQAIEVDKSFIRSAKALLRSPAEPCFATHDPRLVPIVQTVAARIGRQKGSYEFAMYLGRAAGMQQRLIDEDEAVRVYIPFGPRWFERLVGGLAERPSGLLPAIRSLLPGS